MRMLAFGGCTPLLLDSPARLECRMSPGLGRFGKHPVNDTHIYGNVRFREVIVVPAIPMSKDRADALGCHTRTWSNVCYPSHICKGFQHARVRRHSMGHPQYSDDLLLFAPAHLFREPDAGNQVTCAARA